MEQVLTIDNQTKERVKSLLAILENDFSSQYNYLKNRGDVNWDCYNKGNWENTHSIVMEISTILGIQIDSNLDI